MQRNIKWKEGTTPFLASVTKHAKHAYASPNPRAIQTKPDKLVEKHPYPTLKTALHSNQKRCPCRSLHQGELLYWDLCFRIASKKHKQIRRTHMKWCAGPSTDT